MKLAFPRNFPLKRMAWIIGVVTMVDAFAPLTPKPVLWASLVPALIPPLTAIFVIPSVIRHDAKT